MNQIAPKFNFITHFFCCCKRKSSRSNNLLPSAWLSHLNPALLAPFMPAMLVWGGGGSPSTTAWLLWNMEFRDLCKPPLCSNFKQLEDSSLHVLFLRPSLFLIISNERVAKTIMWDGKQRIAQVGKVALSPQVRLSFFDIMQTRIYRTIKEGNILTKLT